MKDKKKTGRDKKKRAKEGCEDKKKTGRDQEDKEGASIRQDRFLHPPVLCYIQPVGIWRKRLHRSFPTGKNLQHQFTFKTFDKTLDHLQNF